MIKVAENRYFLGFRPRQKLFFAFFATLLSLNYYNCKKINRPKPKKLLPLSFVYEYKYQKCHRMKGKVKYILFFSRRHCPFLGLQEGRNGTYRLV